MQKKVTSSIGFLLLFLTVSLASIVANIIRLETNTIFNNGSWESEKSKLQKGVMGGVSYIMSRPALAGGRLHLGSWLGYQEVLYKKAVSPTVVTFRLLLEPDAYVTFLFSGRESRYSGVRFSSNERYANITMHIDPDGKFSEKKILNKDLITARQWHSVQIEFSKRTYKAYIDRRLFTEGIIEHDPQKIGFRGSLKDVMIDDIRIRQNGRPDIVESFDNGRHLPLFIAILIPVLFVISRLCVALLAHIYPLKKSMFIVITVNIILLFGAAAMYIYIVLTQSAYVTNPEAIQYHTYLSNIDSEDTVMKTIARAYSDNYSPDITRILFIGTSQTWGSGASDEQNTYVRKFERLINSNDTSDRRYEVINAGISGSWSAQLFRLYSSAWIKLRPSIVIINLSNNEAGTDGNEFSGAIEEFILLNNKNNILTILLSEPNSIETNLIDLEQNHDIMKMLAVDYHIPFIDMQKNLTEKYDDGFLWWDNVHLTNFGQSVFAQSLYASFTSLFP